MSRLRKLAIWLSIDLVAAVIVFTLLHHKPGRYDPAAFEYPDQEQGQVRIYLTPDVLPRIHNEAQYGRPFDVVITQDGINEIVAGMGWPVVSDGTMLHSPVVLFVPDGVILMGTARIKGVEFVVTIVLHPKIDEQGLMNLHVAKVKVGAMNITPLAKMMARKMYADRLAAVRVDTEAFRTKVAASLLNAEPFDPVFEVEKKTKMRIEQITVEQESLTVRLAPAS